MLEDAANINHIVVFLLPDSTPSFIIANFQIAVLPPDTAVTIHYQWPGKPFQLLGGLSNAKPSAIFALKGKSLPTSPLDPSPTIALGISIEPLSAVEEQLQSLQQLHTTALVRVSTPPVTVIAQRIARNLFNFLTSFATENLPPGVVTLGQLRAEGTYVPLRAFEEWWGKFNHKVESDPGFLERESD